VANPVVGYDPHLDKLLRTLWAKNDLSSASFRCDQRQAAPHYSTGRRSRMAAMIGAVERRMMWLYDNTLRFVRLARLYRAQSRLRRHPVRTSRQEVV
jgi:hypothetical protein